MPISASNGTIASQEARKEVARPPLFALVFEPGLGSARFQRFRRTTLLLLGSVLVCTGLLTLRNLAGYASRLPTQKYLVRDFLQEYLMGRAALQGLDPYASQAELAARYLPEAIGNVFPHACPHPPFVALLAMPLGLVPYGVAGQIWLLLELLCVATYLFVLLTKWERHPLLIALFGTFALLNWHPLLAELALGQLNALLAALLLGCWIAYERGHQRASGLLLGLAVSVKLFPALLIGFFLIRKRYRVVAWASASIALTTVATLVALGPLTAQSYVAHGLPATRLWLDHDANRSLIGCAYRLLAGNRTLAPLLPAPAAVLPLAAALASAIVAICLTAVARSADEEAGFALVLAALLLVTPLAWVHYCTLLAWPLWVAVQRIRSAGWATAKTTALLLAFAALSTPQPTWTLLGERLARLIARGDWGSVRPAAAGLPLLLPTLAVLLLFWLLVSSMRNGPHRANC